MKKFIFFLTSFLSITSILNAQNIMYGFEIGGSFTNLDYNESYDFWNPEFTNSINVMIFSEYKLSESFLQQIGIRYVQQGSHIKYEDYHDFSNHFVYVKGSHDLKQNYILTQYSHGLTSNVKEDRWGVDWKTREISIDLGYFFPI